MAQGEKGILVEFLEKAQPECQNVLYLDSIITPEFIEGMINCLDSKCL